MDNPFSEYGHSKSVEEAIEELALACMANGLDIPLKIIVSKDFMLHYKAILNRKLRFTNKPLHTDPNEPIKLRFPTPAGIIKIETEEA
jgi:hypothetical protein